MKERNIVVPTCVSVPPPLDRGWHGWWARPGRAPRCPANWALARLKNDRIISVHFQGKPCNIMIRQVYAPNTNAKEAEDEWFYDDLQDLVKLTPKKDALFIIRDWNAKEEVKRYLRKQATLALEYKMKQGKS